MWSPCTLAELNDLIAESVARMNPSECRLWAILAVSPVKWRQEPWGNLGGGFWVVGVVGRAVIWYNDIEEGFNVGRYTTPGTIDDYSCNQVSLDSVIMSLFECIENGGMLRSGFGPPEAFPGGLCGT